MARRCVRNEGASTARQCAPVLLFVVGLFALAGPSRAQLTLGPVTVGAGLQASFDHTNTDGAPDTNQFELNHLRLYVNGPVTDNIKFMFNTDYDSVTNKIEILDAVAQFEFSPQVNFWVGRFLPPSDRANLYGPFYSNEWAVYTDGVQDGYPAVFQGRDNGIAYWGTFAKKVKISAGVFDGGSATGNRKLVEAARVQIDFWDPEDGYYLNGTYYGDKNLLALGGATQIQAGRVASTIDFLLEKKLPNAGVFTIESEYADYNRLGGYEALYAESQGAYGLASYIFPKVVPIGKLKGKFEILGKYAKADFTQGLTPNPAFDQKTTEINFDYIIKQFKARVMTFYKDTRFNKVEPNFWQAGVGLQIQM